MKALIVFGTLAELTKVTPFIKARIGSVRVQTLWTRQHIDIVPKAADELGLKESISFFSNSSACNDIEIKLKEVEPDLVTVQGDTESAINGAIAASNLGIPVLHLEAGLRLSIDSEPEERNRRYITKISTYHVATCLQSKLNLLNEGVCNSRLYRVPPLAKLYLGYLASIDRLYHDKRSVDAPYLVVTIHRKSKLQTQLECAESIRSLATQMGNTKMFFIRRPDVRWSGLYKRLSASEGVEVIDMLGPASFHHLILGAAGVLTDSAGVQQECSILGIPHLVLRPESEYDSSAPHVDCLDLKREVHNMINKQEGGRRDHERFSSCDWSLEAKNVWKRVFDWLG